MECNKEDAIRARDLAEIKLQKKDFKGACRFALKAQRLYPNLDNLSQLLLVCNVHWSAEKRLPDNEIDWYCILQIEETADDATIKKQYRKFALQLHPDKNKFSGAEAAFKLIGEAQRMLLDQGKRSLLDSKRRASCRPAAPRCSTWNSTLNVQNNFRSNSSGINLQRHQPKDPAQPGFLSDTFCTSCIHCLAVYQFHNELLFKELCCQYCHKRFIAVDAYTAPAPPSTRYSKPFSTEKDTRDQTTSKVQKKSQGNVGTGHYKAENFGKTTKSSRATSRTVNSKRRKNMVQSSKCNHSGNSSDSGQMATDEDGCLCATKNFGCYGEYPRRSSRKKQKVSYNENLTDDGETVCLENQAKATRTPEKVSGEVSRQKKFEKCGKPNVTADLKGHKELKEKAAACEECLTSKNRGTKETNEKESSREDIGYDSLAQGVVYYQCPDPDFSDFDTDRKEECFAAHQVWAVYDPIDAMPRLYAQVDEVLSPGFKLLVTWLEPDPGDKTLIRWVENNLPVSCGKFKRETTEETDNHLIFSHRVSWEKGNVRGTFVIYPRKGEIWALFKNWDSNWSSNPVSDLRYDYAYVEVLSDHSDGIGTRVAYLCKVKGFASIYCRTAQNATTSFLVLPSEELRFSHRIPSYKMTGEERVGVPKGSFELDPACLPDDIVKINVPDNE